MHGGAGGLMLRTGLSAATAPADSTGSATLATHHRDRLQRVLPREWLEARGAYTATEPSDLARIGASRGQQLLAEAGPVLVYPVQTPTGREAFSLRPDFPRTVSDGKGRESQPRWESLGGQPPWIDLPKLCLPHLAKASAPLVIAEGALKADVAAALLENSGVPAVVIGIAGVWGFKAPALKAEWDALPISGRDVVVLFDSDITVNADVLAAARGLAPFMRARGASSTKYMVLPEADGGGKVDIEDFVAGGGEYEQLAAYLRDDPLPVPDEIEWRTPAEPDLEVVSPGPFPLEVLPALNREVAEVLARSRGASVDLGAAPQLVVAAAAAQQKFELEITPSFRSPTGLMMIISAPPNAGKGTIDHYRVPVAAWEQGEKRKLQEQASEKAIRAKLLALRVKGLEKSIKSAPDDPEVAERYQRELRELESVSEEASATREFLVGNVTLEAWGVNLASNAGCWLMLDSEGGSLVDILAGRYSGSIPDVDIILRSLRGEAYKVTRIGRPGIDVPSVRGSICVAIQPVVAEGWFKDDWLELRGVLNRFIFLSIPPRSTARLTVPDDYVDDGLMTLFNDEVSTLLTLAEEIEVGESGEVVRERFSFTDNGLSAISDFGSSLADRAGEFGDLHIHLGFLERLIPDMVCRIAASLHLLSWAHTVVERRYRDPLLGDEVPALELLIPDDRVRDALKVASWAVQHRQSMVARLEADWTTSGLARLKRLILRRSELFVDERDLLQGLKGKRSQIRTRTDLERLLREAIRLGWVARVATDSGRRELAVNPGLFAELDLPEAYREPSVIDLASGEATS